MRRLILVTSTERSAKTLVSYNLWSMFSLIELTELMRQKDDLEFIQLLNNIRVRNVDEDVENKLKSRFTEKKQ